MDWKARSWFIASLRIDLCMLCSIVLFAVAFNACSETALAQSTVDEHRMKAAFLFHFTQLVDWPADSLNEGGSSLLLCTLGDDPLYEQLESTVAGKQIGSRILHIRHISPPQDMRGCNVLFVSKSGGNRIPALLASVRNTPVLTVGDSDDFLSAGGMIRLFIEGNKIRFEINRQAAEAARLRISSQLLLLAKNVIGANGKK